MSRFELLINDVLFLICSVLDVSEIKNVAYASRTLHQHCQFEKFHQMIEQKRSEKYAGGIRMQIDSQEKVVDLLTRLGLKLKPGEKGSRIIFYDNSNSKSCGGELSMNGKTWQNELINKGTKLIGKYYWDLDQNRLDLRISDDILIRINCADCSYMVSPYENHKIPISGNSLESLMQHYTADNINNYHYTGCRGTWLSPTVDYDSRVYEIPFFQLRNLPIQFEKTTNETRIKFDYEKNDPIYIKVECTYTIGETKHCTYMYYHVQNIMMQLMDIKSFSYAVDW